MRLTIPMVDIPSGARRVLGSLSSKGQPLPLQRVDLRARVIDRVAEVTVEEKFGNPFSDPIEAVYVFPLAGGSAVSRFEMQIGQRVVRGRIEERGQARREYAEALDQGKRAALLEQERDDVFTVQVGNVMPGDEVTVRLTYSERLAGEQVKSQVLVHGGFALLSVLPPARDGFLGAARDVVFVVDRSGSMQGPKMASASRACALLLRTLGPRDRFAVLAFDEVVEWMPGGFQQADEGALDRGEKWLRRIEARGGTELDSAMAETLQQIRLGTEGGGRVPVVVLLTDGQGGGESSVLKRLQAELGGTRVFAVGVDTAVNDGFLRRLAAIGGGTSTFVEPGARLEEALEAVGREIGAPLVTELRLSGDVADIAPARAPDLFAGRPSTVFFRLRGGPVKVTGKLARGGRSEQDIEPREAPPGALA